MKKVLPIIVGLAVLAAAGAGVYYYQAGPKQLPVENVLAEGAVFFYRSSEVAKSVAEFKATKFWQKASAIDVPALMTKGGFTQTEVDMYQNIKEQLVEVLNSPALMQFFGDEIALAVYPADFKFNAAAGSPGQMAMNLGKEVASSFIVVTRLKADAQISEFFSGFYTKLGKNPNIQEKEYKGYKIASFDVPDAGGAVNYVKVKDLMVISWGETGVRSVIDVVTKAKPSLAVDKNFVLLKSKFLPDARTITYVNIESIFSELKGQMLSLANLQPAGTGRALTQKQLEEAFVKINGFKAAGASFVPGVISKQKTDLCFDKSKMDPDLATLYSCQPKANASINFVPRDVLVYQWSSCLSAQYYWNNFKKEMEMASAESGSTQGKANLEAQISQMESSLGLSLEGDILPAIGDEIGGYLTDIDTYGAFPLPKMLVFIKVGDKAKAEKVVLGGTKGATGFVQSEDYSGTSLWYVALPLGIEIEPSLCFFGDYLFFGTSRQMLKDAIDTAKDPAQSLVSNPDFKAVDFGLTEKNNTVSFVKFDELLNRIKAICGWMGDRAEAELQQADAFKEGAQKRLADLQTDIDRKKGELQGLQNKRPTVEQEIADAQAQGLDATALHTKLADLDVQITAKKKAVEQAEDQIPYMEDTVKGYEEKSPDPDTIRFFLDGGVYPILEGLQTIKAAGSRMRFVGDDTIETQWYMKTEEPVK